MFEIPHKSKNLKRPTSVNSKKTMNSQIRSSHNRKYHSIFWPKEYDNIST